MFFHVPKTTTISPLYLEFQYKDKTFPENMICVNRENIVIKNVYLKYNKRHRNDYDTKSNQIYSL